MTHNDWEKEFDEKYGYEYPRCALILKNIEVRDEDDKLIGHINNAAATPESIKSFIRSLLESERTRIAKEIEKLMPKDDGTDTSYFCGAHNALIDVLNLLKP